MLRNTAGQSVHVLAFDENGRRSGIAGSLSITLAIDGGDSAPLGDTSPTEIGTTGEYVYSLTQEETNGHELSFSPSCSIGGVQVFTLPGNVIFTRSSSAAGITEQTKTGVTKIDLDAHYRGDTWAGFTAYFMDAYDNPVDLTGASIRMHVKRSVSDAEPLLEWSTADETIEILNASAGRYRVLGRIVDLPGRHYEYDVEAVLSDGTVITMLAGCWEIIDDVTR